MKSWLLLAPVLVLGIVGLGSFGPKRIPIKSMTNVSEIPGREGSRVGIIEDVRKRGHDLAMFGAG